MTSRIRDTRDERSTAERAAGLRLENPLERVRCLDDALVAFEEMTRARARAGVGELAYHCDLADKLIDEGRVELALEVLAGPVERAVRACWHGVALPGELVDRLGRSLVRLAHESLDGFWFDAAVALHLSPARVLSKETALHLSWLRSEASLGDEALLEAYRRRIRAIMCGMGPEERRSCEDVLRHLPAMADSRH